MPRDCNKPPGKTSAYAFFVKRCSDDHRKKHPNETVDFCAFSRACAAKWKNISQREKKRFEDMAKKDKARYNRQMKNYVPPPKRHKKKRDPTKPKRALSAFFFFCKEERPKVRNCHPDWGVADIAKELGRRWSNVVSKSKYEAKAKKDKTRYEKQMCAYRRRAKTSCDSTSDESDSEDDCDEDDTD